MDGVGADRAVGREEVRVVASEAVGPPRWRVRGCRRRRAGRRPRHRIVDCRPFWRPVKVTGR